MRSYLDHNATSPLRPEARAALEAALCAGNPSSVHREGQRARAHVEVARLELARGLGAAPEEISFGSGATEAANHAVFAARRLGRSRVIRSATEHAAVNAAARTHAEHNEICPVDGQGIIDLSRLEALLSEGGEDTLVAVMAANNETGVVQPLAEVVALARAAGALVLVDAVQMAGRLPFSVPALDIDMVSLSAHKLGGPKGVGALFVRSALQAGAMIAGGGQEHGRRGGTENVAGIAGFGAALSAAISSRDAEAARLGALRDDLEARLRALAPDAVVFGEKAPRLPNTTAFSIPGRAAETLVIALDLEGVAASSGSACSSGKTGAGHVLAAMGVETSLAMGAIRVSLGWTTTTRDIDRFAEALGKALAHSAGPLAAARGAAVARV
ncbi:Cysteine desulfurase [hydrothermal vent metagenome]|uniref:cysteine desulfurase n=1 Tax=hydrothermal vent metagenome TaxID=652676 RepID=A0A3B0TYB6_9ZZZZ